ncbi:MAG: MFS transporter [Chloroflexota bacterium]
MPRLTGLWRHKDFARLWLGQTISELGSRITRDGVPLLAVITLGATPLQMGILSALGSVTIFLFGGIAGVWVDRLRRRPILIAADLGRAIVLATIPAAALLGVLRIEQLYAVIVLTGLFTVFFDVAYLAYLPALVEREHLVEGNSKLALSDSTAEVVGPGLTGVLIQAITAPMAILFDSLSFLASVVSLALIRKPEPPPASPAARQSLWREAREGFRFVLRTPILLALAGSEGTLNFFGAFFGVLYSLYAIRDLGMGAAALGLTIAMGGVGSFLGALLAGRLVSRLGLGVTLVSSLLLLALSAFLIPLARGPLVAAVTLMMAAQLFGDCFRAIYFIHEVSLRQAVTPDAFLGRAHATLKLLVAGVSPLGALVGGALGQAIGVRAALMVAAGGTLLATLWLFFSPVYKLQKQPPFAREVI